MVEEGARIQTTRVAGNRVGVVVFFILACACSPKRGSVAQGTPAPSSVVGAVSAPASAVPSEVNTAVLEVRLVVDGQEPARSFRMRQGGSINLAPDAIVTACDVSEATAVSDNGEGRVAVSLVPAAVEAFEDFTERHVRQRLAIVVDGAVVSAPVVQARIGGGHITVSGISTEEANQLAERLRRRAKCAGAASAVMANGAGCAPGAASSAQPMGMGGASGDVGPSCPKALKGPALVGIPTPDGGKYCIDATEVTNGQYAQFVAAKRADTSGQPAWCSWNTSYTPSSSWPAAGKSDQPVVYVDWCDAYAYCKWAGKHMCGKIGGGANRSARRSDATKSEWFNACSKGGVLKYPYGCAYDPAACAGTDGGSAGARPVGSMRRCEGGYAGLFDLSGNVSEWDDVCESGVGAGDQATAGAGDACSVRGGSAYFRGEMGCADVVGARRDTALVSVGFRCCADAE